MGGCATPCTTAPVHCWFNTKAVVQGTMVQDFVKVVQCQCHILCQFLKAIFSKFLPF